jgi:hypothetical protein
MIFRVSLAYSCKKTLQDNDRQSVVRVYPGVWKDIWKGEVETICINRNETQEPPESWISPDHHTHEDSSSSKGAGMLLIGQDHINNW